MDQNNTPQQPSASPGADDQFVDNPSFTPPQNQVSPTDQQTGSLTEGGSDDEFQTNPDFKPNDPLTINSNDSTLTKVGKAVAAPFAGIGQGVFSTAAGVADLANHIPNVQLPSEALHHLAGDDVKRSNLEDIGYGGETLMEFLMGDETLKSLGMGQRLEAAAKVTKTLEKSPRLMKALQIGANVVKNASVSAARAGIVQGIQTGIRSGGNPKEAGLEGLGTALTTGVLEGTLGAVGAAAKIPGAFDAARTGETISDLTNRAANAPSEQDIFAPLGNKIRDTQAKIDGIFDQAKTDSETANKKAQADYNQQLTDANETTTAKRNQLAQETESATTQAKIGSDFTKAASDEALNKSKQLLQTNLVDDLTEATNGSLPKEEAAELLSNAINAAHDSLHSEYEKGLTGPEGLETQLTGVKPLEVKGSNMSQAAQSALDNPIPSDHPGVKEMKEIGGDKLDAKTRTFLEKYAAGEEILEPEGPKTKTQTGTAGPETTVPIKPYTIHDLVELSEATRRAASKYQIGDPNARALHEFRQGILSDIDQMAASSTNPEAAKNYANLRNTYRQNLANLNSKTAKTLRLNQPDKAMSDAAGFFKSGGNAVGKLSTIKAIAGPELIETIAKTDAADDLLGLAKSDPDKFISRWENPKQTPDWLKQQFYGPELTKSIQEAADNYKAGLDHAQQKASQESLGAMVSQDTATAQAKERTKWVNELIDYGHADTVGRIKDQYDTALQSAQDTLEAAKQQYGEDSQIFKNSLVRSLDEGHVNENLLTGKVDLQDLRALKSVIGDNWKAISDGIFARGIAKAEGNPEDILKWWNDMKPEVRAELFDTASEANGKSYDALIKNVQDAQSAKLLLRNGVLRPLGYGGSAAAGVVGGALTHQAPFVDLLGGMASTSLGVGLGVNKLIDYVADHPNTWKALSRVEKVAAPIAKAATVVAPKSSGIAKGALTTLGINTGQQTKPRNTDRYAPAQVALGSSFSK